jgi:hypothetical protein
LKKKRKNNSDFDEKVKENSKMNIIFNFIKTKRKESASIFIMGLSYQLLSAVYKILSTV